MKNDRRLATLIVLITIIFLWIYVRPVWVRSNCYKSTHFDRPHENDSEWAEGKQWREGSLLNKMRGIDSPGGWSIQWAEKKK